MATRPNILMLSMDGCRYDALGCNGNPLARTPNLDHLATQGVRFDRAYCSHPACMPSRSSIITGRYPHAHGAWENGVPLDEREVTLGQVLGDAGYHTACYGKFHFRPWLPSLEPDETAHRPEHPHGGPYFGFEDTAVVDHSDKDAYTCWVRDHHPEHAALAENLASERPDGQLAWKSSLPAAATKTAFIAERTIDALHRQNGEQPFLIWSSFIDPHHPYAPPRPYADWYDDAAFSQPPANAGPPSDRPPHYRQWQKLLCEDGPWQLGDTPQTQWQQIRRMYQAKVSHVDAEIGRILQALDEQGLSDNTIVVFFSDHGWMLGDFGLMQVGPYSMETMVRVPMIWRVPGGVANTSAQGLASLIDLMPTLLDRAGVDAPLGVQGRSLAAVLDDPAQSVRDQLLIEMRWGQNPPDGFRTLVTERYKLGIYADGRAGGELYDLHEDPQELHNRFAHGNDEPLRGRLSEMLAQELIRQEDPLPRRVGCW